MRRIISAVLIFMITGLFSLSPAVRAAEPPPEGDISGVVDFTLKDINSNEISMASYRAKKPVLLIFWASWCPYCLKGLRDLNQKYPELKRSGIEVLAINAGESLDKAARVVSNYGLQFKVLLDPAEETVEYFQVVGIPLYVLVNKQGKVIFRDNSYPAGEINKIIAQ
jgi:peroxiredoxin